jgi:hypothetical protein
MGICSYITSPTDTQELSVLFLPSHSSFLADRPVFSSLSALLPALESHNPPALAQPAEDRILDVLLA